MEKLRYIEVRSFARKPAFGTQPCNVALSRVPFLMMGSVETTKMWPKNPNFWLPRDGLCGPKSL